MKGKHRGFVRLENLGAGQCRYVACWRVGVPLVFGSPFEEAAEPGEKLKLLRAICRELEGRVRREYPEEINR